MPNIPLEIMQEAYNKEVQACGLWFGNEQYPYPGFYAYIYPTPDDFKSQQVQPAQAIWSNELGEFLLPYDALVKAANPEETLMQFLQATYEAAADTAGWDREGLEMERS